MNLVHDRLKEFESGSFLLPCSERLSYLKDLITSRQVPNLTQFSRKQREIMTLIEAEINEANNYAPTRLANNAAAVAAGATAKSADDEAGGG
jgi:hypothetical protein